MHHSPRDHRRPEPEHLRARRPRPRDRRRRDGSAWAGPQLAIGLAIVLCALVAFTILGPRLTGLGSAGPAGSAGGTALAATPAVSLGPTFVRPTPTPVPTPVSYVVRSGDSLNTIARAFGTTARSIAFWNRDRFPSLDPDSSSYSPGRIAIGWQLEIHPRSVYDEAEKTDAPAPSPSPTA